MTLSCRNGHPNPPDHRFCRTCGEPLTLPSAHPASANPSPPQTGGVATGQLLRNRYRIERELGQGGFGRTYLAQDAQRFNEPCVLKEFVPMVQGEQALQKAQQLFEREAGVLYQLQHPQIPRFRELFRATGETGDRLFLVQDYVEGRTYRSILAARKAEGGTFSEFEVLQLMTQLLPVLDYIHRAGVIHRDIAPDNLMLRFEDQLPVLIDFGGVKQVAAIASQVVGMTGASASPSTRLGKVGYAPQEQMEWGKAYPHSDLYALAVTALVLLTGKEPQQLFAEGKPPWTSWVNLSPQFRQILQRMLAEVPRDRYPSALDVLDALQGKPVIPAPAPPPPAAGYTSPPPTYNPDPLPQPTLSPTSASVYPTQSSGGWWRWLGVLIVMLAAGGGGWWAANQFFLAPPPEEPIGSETAPTEPEGVEPVVSSNLPSEEQRRKEELGERRRSLGVDYNFLVDITNLTFFERFPEQEGRTLTDTPEDAEWRDRWDAIAVEWLDVVETHLSAAARERLGSYVDGDVAQWTQQVNEQFVSSRALLDLTNAAFFQLFPEYQDQEEFFEPVAQVWSAMAFDQVNGIVGGDRLEEVAFAAGSFSTTVDHTLEPGEGRIYIAHLSENQQLRLNLQAPQSATLLSVYVPNPSDSLPSLLEDSDLAQWSDRLPQSGYYEIVVVSTSDEPLAYTLTIAVDNVTDGSIKPEVEDPQLPKL